MLKFSDDIVQCVYRLRERYGTRRNCVVLTYPIIEILKYFKDREYSTKLFYDPQTHTFEMQAPDHKYVTKISYYDYQRPERRWTRSINHLFPLVKDLKACGLWVYIANKDFIVLNQLNTRASNSKRQKMLDLLISED